MSGTAGIISVAAALFLSSGIYAQNWNSAGIFNSPKGFGFSAQVSRQEGHFNNFQLYADIFGLLSGRQKEPGVKFAYDYCAVLNDIDSSEFTVSFYAGPGVTLGYVTDYELEKGRGAVFAVNALAGILLDFKRKPFCFNISWTLEAGMHLRSNDKLGIGQLSFYKNGAFRSVLPQLSIEYIF